jgi:hypothetical protein
MYELNILYTKCTDYSSDGYLSQTMSSLVVKHDEDNLFSQRYMTGICDFNSVIGFSGIGDSEIPSLNHDAVKQFRERCLQCIHNKRIRLEYLITTYGVISR